MTGKPTEIFDAIAADPTYCNRCFVKSMPSQKRAGSLEAPASCSKSCGRMDIKMESGSLTKNEAVSRAKNLLTALEEHGVDADREAMIKAAERLGWRKPSRTAFIETIAYGIGVKDSSELEEDRSPEMEHNRGLQTDEQEEEPIEVLCNGPVTKRLVEELEDETSVEEHVRVFEVPDPGSDIYYLDNPRAFADQYDIDEIGDHSSETIARGALHANWGSLDTLPTPALRSWIDRTNDRISQHILPVALEVGPHKGKYPDDHYTFRQSAFWPLIKENLSQPLLGHMRREHKDFFSVSELADASGLVELATKNLLMVLEEEDTVEKETRGWTWTGDEIRFRREDAFGRDDG